MSNHKALIAKNDRLVDKMALSIFVMLPIFTWFTTRHWGAVVLVVISFGIGWIAGVKRLPFGKTFADEFAAGQLVLDQLEAAQVAELRQMLEAKGKRATLQALQDMTGIGLRQAMHAITVLEAQEEGSAPE